ARSPGELDREVRARALASLHHYRLNWEEISAGRFDRECSSQWRRDVPTYQYRCRECGKSFERSETITEHGAAKVRCPKCNSKKVAQVPGRVHVVTSKKS